MAAASHSDLLTKLTIPPPAGMIKDLETHFFTYDFKTIMDKMWEKHAGILDAISDSEATLELAYEEDDEPRKTSVKVRLDKLNDEREKIVNVASLASFLDEDQRNHRRYIKFHDNKGTLYSPECNETRFTFVVEALHKIGKLRKTLPSVVAM